MNNFRPISILHVLSKILEKLMKTRVNSYLEKEKIICDKQYGFRSGYNTSDAIVEVVDKCVNCLDDGLFTVVVCLDLSKAFDTVNKNILIRKMECMGFRGAVLDWFESYLTGRRMYVEIEGHKSVVKDLNIGLPQGSVSSPYLFSLYINEMKNSSDKLNFTHFADDTTVFMSGNDIETLCRDISFELDKVSRWLKVNRLSLNIEKTQFMLLTHRNAVGIPISVAIDGVELAKTDCVKFLGVLIDDRLSYKQHVLSTTKRLSSIIGIMRRVKPLVPSAVMRQIYFSMFHSILTYGVIVWGGCGKTSNLKICNVQERALKILRNMSPPILLPPVFDDVYKLSTLLQLHKYVHHRDFSEYFHTRILSLVPDHDHQTRFNLNNNLMQPAMRKTTTQKQFFNNVIKEWNKLPHSLKGISDGKKFKCQVKEILFT